MITKFISRVKRKFPTTLPVYVRTVKMVRNFATASHRDTCHNIYLKRGLDLSEACEAFIHEYAHCLDVEKNPNRIIEHNPAWAIYYAQLYREYERFLLDEGYQ